MIRNNVAYSILIFILIGIISSCQKPVEYPIIPAIAFKELYSVPFTSSIGGTVYMTMSFTDGDGNVGLGQKDTLYPYKYNLYVTLYTKQKGVFSKYIFSDSTSNFNARIPILNANSPNKTLKGDILYKMDFLTVDTCKMDVYIVDRDMNKSNVVTTPEFVIR